MQKGRPQGYSKIKTQGLEPQLIPEITNPNLSNREIERRMKQKGIDITDDTIGKYRESIIQSGIIEIDEELKTKINNLIRNLVDDFETLRSLFSKNIKELKSRPNFFKEAKDNPQIVKTLNTLCNLSDKITRTIQLINPSKAIDVELIKKRKREVIRFDNL